MWQKGITAIWLFGLSLIDIRKKSVPVWLLGVGAVWAIFLLFFNGGGTKMDLWHLGGSLLPGMALLAVAAATGKSGCGDGMVVLLLGLSEGRNVCLIGLAAGMFILSLVSGVLLAIRKVKRNTQIPFLPFLTVGWGIAVCGKWGVL